MTHADSSTDMQMGQMTMAPGVPMSMPMGTMPMQHGMMPQPAMMMGQSMAVRRLISLV